MLRLNGISSRTISLRLAMHKLPCKCKIVSKKGIAEVIIAKQRNGPIGTIELVWLPDYTKFANLQK